MMADKEFSDEHLCEIRRLLRSRHLAGSSTPREDLGWNSPWSFDGFKAELILFLIDSKLGPEPE